jgi:hypothetical protein
MPGLIIKKTPRKAGGVRLSPAKRSASKKPAVRNLFNTPKKASPKKASNPKKASSAKKPAAKKSPVKKASPAKKAAPRNLFKTPSPAKKSPVKKTTATKKPVKRAATTGKKAVAKKATPVKRAATVGKKPVSKKLPVKRKLGKLVYMKLPAGKHNCPKGYHTSPTYKNVCIKDRGVKAPAADRVKPHKKCLPGQHYSKSAKKCVGKVDQHSLPIYIKNNIKKVAKTMGYTKTNKVEWTAVFKKTVQDWKKTR